MAQGTLAAKHGIEALPSLVVMGGRDGGVITTEGRLDVNPNLTPLQIYSQWATALPSANAAHPSSVSAPSRPLAVYSHTSPALCLRGFIWVDATWPTR